MFKCDFRDDVCYRLFNERVAQIEAKLAEVRTGTAQEYLIPLGILEQNMHHRFEVAGIGTD